MVFTLAFFCFPGGIQSALSATKIEESLQPSAAPDIIYVSNFELDAASIHQDQGIGGSRSKGILASRLNSRQGLLKHGEAPETTASKLVNLMAESLVQNLSSHSLRTTHLQAGQLPPKKGWLIQGEFLEVDEGNRLKRAIIGFGAGATEMRIHVKVTDLGRQPSNPFLVLGVGAGDEHAPGAAVTLNPYVAAAKFVLAKHATEKDVRNAASQIAGELIKYMQSRGLIDKGP